MVAADCQFTWKNISSFHMTEADKGWMVVCISLAAYKLFI